ncbi:type I phosphodiesterase/nucleotide pyrophosphatase [Thermosediminibacter oceani DSM 16646]|uniref:Type I phosphodiesterase/nucleotide pyrophosphatase n=1 Tax=Thermosediminibacter oceani (strain ATCC BAA-1034 / DSM 16646 / JW/IW-1228P) TaxID=555079 RepID=D9S088_THEOJ|nr:type I phosphodiesterase/nucleotide pyrophosphatase [Thermosediminibacter oceani DSM 16646]
MEKGKRYLLFLKATDSPGVYSIVSLNQGKFNIDNLDTKEKELEQKDGQFKTLKQDVLNKFNSRI